jgi:UDP-N-acetylglucosamine 2-epimerase (non-hydrolysing)
MNALRPLLVFGTRPEAIKMAPVVRACHARDDLEPIVCVTGQHGEMLAQVLDDFGIEPDVRLDVMRPDQGLSGLTARLLEGLDEQLLRLEPTHVVAQGDTTTVMAAAMAAFHRRIPFVHVEAGLRTGNLDAPWPEEYNRRVAGLTAALHCAPTTRARDNLLREGVPAERVHVTGNTVIDALLATIARERGNSERWAARFPFLGDRRMVLVTGHRRENFGAGFERVCTALAQLASDFPEVAFVYPVHLNPHVQRPVRAMLSGLANVHLLAPAAYPEFVWLMDRATLLLTDSGGVQEEAPSLRKPVLVTRETTERPEAVDAGAVELVGTDTDRIHEAVARLLVDETEYERRLIDVNPYGDGRAAERIAGLLAGTTMWEPVEAPEAVLAP